MRYVHRRETTMNKLHVKRGMLFVEVENLIFIFKDFHMLFPLRYNIIFDKMYLTLCDLLQIIQYT